MDNPDIFALIKADPVIRFNSILSFLILAALAIGAFGGERARALKARIFKYLLYLVPLCILFAFLPSMLAMTDPHARNRRMLNLAVVGLGIVIATFYTKSRAPKRPDGDIPPPSKPDNQNKIPQP